MKNRIKECRKSTGMTPEELGKAIGLTGRVIINYENGFREPSSLSIWEELASTLHVSPAYLVGWSDKKNSKEEKMMTTKELIAALAEANVFDEIENDDATIAVCCDNNLMLEIPKDATNWLEVYNPAVQLWKNCSAVKRSCISLTIDEYLGTPLEDREDKPKYRVRLRGFNSVNGHQYLAADREDVKTAKFFACAERPDLKQEFTQDELDYIANRNQFKGVSWLQDLIRHAEPVEDD